MEAKLCVALADVWIAGGDAISWGFWLLLPSDICMRFLGFWSVLANMFNTRFAICLYYETEVRALYLVAFSDPLGLLLEFFMLDNKVICVPVYRYMSLESVDSFALICVYVFVCIYVWNVCDTIYIQYQK